MKKVKRFNVYELTMMESIHQKGSMSIFKAQDSKKANMPKHSMIEWHSRKEELTFCKNL